MPDNTYILITTRNPKSEKLAPHITRALENVQVTDTMRVFADAKAENGAENHKVLKAYTTTKVKVLDGSQMRSLTKKEADEMLKLCGGTFLNLKLYAKLAESGIPVKELPALESKALFERYLREIRKYYGDKLFDEAMTTLYAIVTAEEPLTLREVAWLSGDEFITPKLLSFLRDFGALLKTTRETGRGSLISPASERYREYIETMFPEQRAELAAIFTDKLLHTDLEQYKDKNGNYTIPDGLFYMAAYLPKVTDEISEELRNRVYIKDRERTDIYDCVTKSEKSRDRYVLKRRTKMGEVWSEYCEKVGWYEEQIRFIKIAGDSYWRICDYDKSLDVANRRIALCQQYLAEKKIVDENLLAAAYMNRGVTYGNIGKYGESLNDCGQCIAIREALREQDQLEDEDNLAAVYMNRGLTYWNMGKYEESLSDYNKCIAIEEDLYKQGMLEDENALAKAYLNRGNTLDDVGRNEESLKNYDKCIAIRETLHEAGKLYEIGHMATAMLNKGILPVSYTHLTLPTKRIV